MKKSILTIYFSLALAITGCSQKTEPSESVDNSTPQSTQAASTAITFKATIDPQLGKTLKGDYTAVKFQLNDRPYHSFLEGDTTCINQNIDNDSAQEIVCTSNHSLAKLNQRIYRLWLLEQDDETGLFCEMLDYQRQPVLNILLTTKSTGSCILANLQAATKLSEQEIKNRIKTMLNEPNAEDYDLEETLYDLAWYYHEEGNNREADGKILAQAILANKPLPPLNQSTINGSMQSLN